jgi:hypothetical protein
MRSMLLAPVLALSVATACGRIGYTPLSDGGAGGMAGMGSGGSGPGSAGNGGASGSAAGASGAAGGGASGAAGGGARGAAGSGAAGGGAAGGGAAGGGASGAGGGVGGRGAGGAGGGGAAGGVGGRGTGGAGANGTGGGGASGAAGGGASGAGGGAAGAAGGPAGGTIGGGGASGALCPTDTFGGHTYAFCAGTLSWADAQSDCMAKGMRLTRLDTSAENTWVQSIAFAGISSVSSIYWSWIGASDLAVSGEWRWTDGTLFWLGNMNGAAQGGLYENWVASSPGNGGSATDCGILEHSGFWKDYPCSTLERYVCEQY